MQELVDISIIIPALNEEAYLPTCLKSLQNQSFNGSYEIIVVNNNSTDNTVKVAEEYGAFVVTELRKGVCFARQRGVEAARGKIIISTDADCEYSPNWVQNHYDAFMKNPGVVGTFGPFEFTAVPKWGKIFSISLFKLVKFIYEKKGKIVYVGASNFAFRKDVWKKVGGYNTGLAQGGDEYDLLTKLRKHGCVMFVHNKVITSSRRLRKGFLYSIFVTLFVYYILDYLLAYFLTGKSVFGHYPAFRQPAVRRKMLARMLYGGLYVGIVLAVLSMSKSFKGREVQAKTVAFSHGKNMTVAIGRKAKTLFIRAQAMYDTDDK